MKLFITEGLTGAYDLDQRTTPDVVTISNVSSMAASQAMSVCEGAAPRRGKQMRMTTAEQVQGDGETKLRVCLLNRCGELYSSAP